MLAPGKGLPRDLYLAIAGISPKSYGYIVRNLERTSAGDYAPRFGVGKADETDLSLLKAETYTFGGGMFQRSQKDNDRNAVVYGRYNDFDETIYGYTNGVYIYTGGGGTDAQMTAECYGNQVCFIAETLYTGAYTNRIRKVEASGITSMLTLPAAIGSPAYAGWITSMVVIGKYLIVSSQNPSWGNNVHRYDMQAGTWQDVGGQVEFLSTLRGRLYGLSYDGSIWSVADVSATTYAWQQLYTGTATKEPTSFYEFNGALWLSQNGLTYRFDGVNRVEVLSHETIYAEVYNGAVYYMVKKWLYRFNGSIVERVQYIDEEVKWLRCDDENLYILTSTINQGTGFKDPDAGIVGTYGTLNGRVYYYNGVGFYQAHEIYDLGTGYPNYPKGLARFKDGIVLQDYQYTANVGTYKILCPTIDFSGASAAQYTQIYVHSSELDNGFPNNWKNPQYIDVNADGWRAGAYAEVITVQVQMHDGSAWTAWTTVGTVTATSKRIVIPNTETYLYKMIRVRLAVNDVPVPAVRSNLSIRSFTIRYTLQPRQRGSYRVDFVLPQDGAFSTKDRRNNPINDAPTTGANLTYAYRGLMQSLHSKLPVFILGMDYGTSNLKTLSSIGSSTGSVSLIGNMPFTPLPNRVDEATYIGLSNDDGVTWEIAEVSTVTYDATGTETIIVVSKRAVLGTAITVNNNTIYAPAVKVFCNRLISERIIVDGAYNQQSYTDTETNEFTNTERIVSLEFIEV